MAVGDIILTRGKAGITETNLAARLPAGTILDYGGTSTPSGFLNCDGSNVSRTTYADLFTAIGTSFGAGNGTTTFSLPDFRRKVAVGSGGTASSVLSNTVGSGGGAETHQLSVAELATHNHGGNTGSSADAYVKEGNTYIVPDGAAHGFAYPSATHTHTVSSAGSGTAHNNMQPSLVVYKIIKT